jgi:hypothetical protein
LPNSTEKGGGIIVLSHVIEGKESYKFSFEKLYSHRLPEGIPTLLSNGVLT